MTNLRDEKVLESTLSTLKEELEDHLDAINSNTNEIISNYEYLCQLDARLSKIEEKLDELLHASGITFSKYKDFKLPRLTKNEQELFDFLLTQIQPLSCKEIAFKLALTQQISSDYLTALIEKGIPIVKRYSGSDILIALDPKFHDEMQTRKNSIKLNLAD